MSNCTSGCLTQDHANWGECLRSKSLRIAYARSAAGQDATVQRRWDEEIGRYRNAVAQGIEPDGTTTVKVRQAEQWSEHHGIAFTPDNVDAVRTQKILDKVLN
jgi:hypothetical protein